MRIGPLLAITLLLTACTQSPDSYPPPDQREALSLEEAGSVKTFVTAADPHAESYFIKDVWGLEQGQWRWTGEEPTFHFVLEKAEGLKFVMDFSVAGATLKDTGPTTVRFLVNDHLLAEQRYEQPGQMHIERPVDPSWIEANADTLVKVTIDPAWVASTGKKLGIIFSRAGFVEEE